MVYIENTGLREFSGFLQIGSQIAVNLQITSARMIAYNIPSVSF